MDRPPTPDPELTDDREPQAASEQREAHEDEEGRFPMPSPLAVAFAVIALLAFGVGLGVYTRPEASTPVTLAESPAGTPSSASTTSTTTSEAETSAAAEAEASSGGSEGEAPSQTEEESQAQTASSAEESSQGQETGSEAGEGNEAAEGKEQLPHRRAAGGEPEASKLPPIKHVFVIVLGEQGYEAAFGAGSEAPYLAKTLRQQGELIGDYYGVASGQLANEIALVSGQGPTSQTASDCPVYEALAPGTAGPEGQTLGNGCVYPIDALTIGDQLVAAGDTWKAYVQGLNEGTGAAAGSQASCPNPSLGAPDPHSAPTAESTYVTWRDPFLYFRSTIEGASCGEENVGVGQLGKDLGSAASTPTLSYVSPDVCEDGDEAQQCAAGSPTGLKAAEGFLRRIVPQIEGSAAYREGGLLAITFDQAPQSGPHADSTGCCATPKYPNLPASSPSSSTAGQPTGGGRVGLLLISKYVKPGSSYVTGQYNHFSLLASIEALFKLKSLGYAGNVQLPTFERAVYNAYS